MIRLVCSCLLILILFVSSGSKGQAESPAGTWKGRWNSTSTGHSGPLRARIWPDGNGGYDARFSGRFAWVVPFTYRAKLQQNTCGQWVSSRRMPIVGTYRTTATVAGGRFHASYAGGRETGTFEMIRRPRRR